MLIGGLAIFIGFGGLTGSSCADGEGLGALVRLEMGGGGRAARAIPTPDDETVMKGHPAGCATEVGERRGEVRGLFCERLTVFYS